jgi:hypothetical protein
VTSPAARELTGLLVAARLWADRQPLDEERVRRARDAVLLLNHRRYVAAVPAYARLAADLGRTEVDDVAVLVDDLLVGTALFKSYDDELLRTGDFAGLTEWLGEVSTLSPAPRLDGVGSVDQWRERLAADGVFVTVSSGTSGRPSFVPRDAATLAALRSNGAFYSALSWPASAAGHGAVDCLLVTAPGTGSGLQAVATGLAALRAEGGPAAFAAAAEVVRRAGREGRPVLLFGAPAAVAGLAASMRATGRRLPLPDGALLVTGGGWKQGWGELRPEDFPSVVADAFGLADEQRVDVYGMSECNAYLLRCPAGRYHVPPVLEAVVVGEDLRALPGADATGLIGLLDPFAFSYPGCLLTGDRGRLVRTPCPCGLAGPGFVGEIVRAPGEEAKGCAGLAPGVLV